MNKIHIDRKRHIYLNGLPIGTVLKNCGSSAYGQVQLESNWLQRHEDSEDKQIKAIRQMHGKTFWRKRTLVEKLKLACGEIKEAGYTHTDAGRNKFLRFERPDLQRPMRVNKSRYRDCVLKSFVLMTGFEYAEAYDCIQHIQRTKDRHLYANDNPTPFDGVFPETLMKEFALVHIANLNVKRSVSANSMAQILADKRVILGTTDHLVYAAGGKLHDEWDSRGAIVKEMFVMPEDAEDIETTLKLNDFSFAIQRKDSIKICL